MEKVLAPILSGLGIPPGAGTMSAERVQYLHDGFAQVE